MVDTVRVGAHPKTVASARASGLDLEERYMDITPGSAAQVNIFTIGDFGFQIVGAGSTTELPRTNVTTIKDFSIVPDGQGYVISEGVSGSLFLNSGDTLHADSLETGSIFVTAPSQINVRYSFVGI